MTRQDAAHPDAVRRSALDRLDRVERLLQEAEQRLRDGDAPQRTAVAVRRAHEDVRRARAVLERH